MSETVGIRSRGSADARTSPGAVAIHTAEAGPPGPPLRAKYMRYAVKGTKGKASGNSGNVGRRANARARGHGGGQISGEEKIRRERQSAEALNRRTVVVD